MQYDYMKIEGLNTKIIWRMKLEIQTKLQNKISIAIEWYRKNLYVMENKISNRDSYGFPYPSLQIKNQHWR